MSKAPNNIDRLVKEKLDGFEMTPPPSVWGNTSSLLKTGRIKYFFLWFSLIAILMTSAAVGVYFYSQENSIKTPLAEKSESQKKNQPEKTKIDSEKEIQDDLNLTIDSGNYANNHELNSNSRLNGNSSATNLDNNSNSNSQASKSNGDMSLASSNDHTNDGQSNSGHSSDIGDYAKTKGIATSKGKSGSGRNDNDTNPSTDLNEDTDSGNQNAAKSDDRAKAELIDSLNTSPIQFLPTKQAHPQLTELKEEPLPVKDPFWKSISLEGSLGMSTFNNKLVGETAGSLLPDLLKSASSNRRSFDFRLGANYHFTPNVSFQTGLEYSSEREDYAFKAQQITIISYLDSTISSIDSLTMDTTYSYIDVIAEQTEIVDKKEPNHYKILTLPFQFAYSKSLGIRGELEIALGGALTILGRNSGTVIVDQSNYTIPAQSGYHTKGMLSIGGSLKYIHHFGEHHALYISPWARFGITSQATGPISYRSVRNKYGIRFGYRFYF